MDRHAQGRQLDLIELALSEAQRQRLGPFARSEIVSLLKLLIDECGTAHAKTNEADDE